MNDGAPDPFTAVSSRCCINAIQVPFAESSATERKNEVRMMQCKQSLMEKCWQLSCRIVAGTQSDRAPGCQGRYSTNASARPRVSGEEAAPLFQPRQPHRIPALSKAIALGSGGSVVIDPESLERTRVHWGCCYPRNEATREECFSVPEMRALVRSRKHPSFTVPNSVP